MSNTPLTKEHLAEFGPGDQFQFLRVMTTTRVIAEMAKEPEILVSDCVRVQFNKPRILATTTSAISKPRMDSVTSVGHLNELEVISLEPGYLHVRDTVTQQGLVFIKPEHHAFWREPTVTPTAQGDAA